MHAITDQDFLDIPMVFFDTVIEIIEAQEAESYMPVKTLKSSMQDYKNTIKESFEMCHA
jgi:hypothetical protein